MRSHYPLPVLVLVGLFLTGLVSGQDVQDVYVWEGFEPIPDMDPFGTGAEIVIPAGKLPTTITDLDVDLIVEHNFQGDLSVTLTHADSGQTIVLMNRPGDPEFPPGFAAPNLGNPFTFEEFFFDDEAALPYDFPFVDFPGIPATEFTVSNEHKIDLFLDKSSAVFYKKLNKEEKSAVGLSWQWKVDQSIPVTGMAEKGDDDRPVAVHIWFTDKKSGGLKRFLGRLAGYEIPGQLLTYVWPG